MRQRRHGREGECRRQLSEQPPSVIPDRIHFVKRKVVIQRPFAPARCEASGRTGDSSRPTRLVLSRTLPLGGKQQARRCRTMTFDRVRVLPASESASPGGPPAEGTLATSDAVTPTTTPTTIVLVLRFLVLLVLLAIVGMVVHQTRRYVRVAMARVIAALQRKNRVGARKLARPVADRLHRPGSEHSGVETVLQRVMLLVVQRPELLHHGGRRAPH